jgi:hypothetical protein
MAPGLKRKRDLGDAVGVAKTARAGKNAKKAHIPEFSQGGWAAAFNPPPKSQELIQTNGINGDGIPAEEEHDISDAVDFEAVEERRQKRENRKLMRKVLTATNSNEWKVSEPIGGRQMNVEPVFTRDEK